MPNRQERRAPSARTRILGWYIVLLAVSLVAALFVQRAFLLAQVSAEIDESLDQEVAELGQLAQGTNPETGELFGDDAAAVFDLFLSRNVPLLGEAVVTLVDGQPYKSDVSGAELARGDLVDEWAAVTVPVRREVDLPSGRLRYVAVPLTYEGEIEGLRRFHRCGEAVRQGRRRRQAGSHRLRLDSPFGVGFGLDRRRGDIAADPGSQRGRPQHF
jgi:hypothetical protein